ncbi:MAG TPA: acyltransferase family protein [Lunatimonas sp.]|nr:acyltransferase family protein [Lunatimonas sp.]
MSLSKIETGNKKRIEYIDALKGFAIFLVLWGHSLQYLKNGYDAFQNPVFEFIYSFHMPLFFMISGFFFRSSLKLNIKDYLVKKSLQLLLPCFVWAILFFIQGIIIDTIEGREYFFNNWLDVVKHILASTWGVWFLRELFISYLIAYVSLKLFKNAWLACVLSISLVLISPFLAELQRVFLPVFWAGFFLKDYYPIFLKYVKKIFIISAVVFSICLLFWNGNYTMYITNFPSLINFKELTLNVTNINISIFRLFIGLCGSTFFFALFEILYSDSKFFSRLSKIGVNTLAIYLLQRLFLEYWGDKLIDFTNMNIWIYSLLVTPLISLTILIICFIIIKSINNKYAELLLFGKT